MKNLSIFCLMLILATASCKKHDPIVEVNEIIENPSISKTDKENSSSEKEEIKTEEGKSEEIKTPADDLGLDSTPENPTEIPVTGIKFASSSIEVEAGKTTRLQVLFEPENATNKDVTFTFQNWYEWNNGPIKLESDGTILAHAYTGAPAVTVIANSGVHSAKISIEVVREGALTKAPSDVTPAELNAQKPTYATLNRVGGDGGTSPWYAICFLSDKEVGIGMCSIRRENAIKLARAGAGSANGGASSGHKLKYTYDSATQTYTLDGSVRIIGGDFYIQGDVLFNTFFTPAIKFDKVKD